MRKILTPIYKKIGGFEATSNEEVSDKLKLKRLITSSACDYEVEDCVKDAKALFIKFQENPDNNM